ncbi:hypothetical protein M0813_28227 [Anaeramoeba flamelloides]|uniref:Uncharacterized protein n=1 Tax=Anaeramoeba flamelloides TaxID=1746091 RepID=A0ABQ8XVW5_9EUKA|nr:hypothetical protein M0813_28227 [Anaeramoeba flamelloides]
MFIPSRGFDPNQYDPVKHEKFVTSIEVEELKTKDANEMRDDAHNFLCSLFQYPNLTVKEAFKSVTLLNTLNIIFPSKYNQVKFVDSQTKQKQKNIKEYLKGLKELKYEEKKLFNLGKLLESNEESEGEIYESVLFLKECLSKNGVQRMGKENETKNENKNKNENENENENKNKNKRVYYLCRKQKLELKSSRYINLELVQKKNVDGETVWFNVFYLKNKEQRENYILKRRTKINESRSKKIVLKKKNSKSKTSKPKNGKGKLHLRESEYKFEPLDPLNKQSKYLVHDLADCFKLLNKSKRFGYIYEAFFMINYLDDWNVNEYRLYSEQSSNSIEKKYHKYVKSCWEDYRKYLMLGEAHFDVKVTNNNLKGFRDGVLKLGPKSFSINYINVEGTIVQQKWGETKIVIEIHKTDPLLIYLQNFKKKSNYQIRFDDETRKIRTILTFLAFQKAHYTNAKIGINEDVDEADLSQITANVLPPPKAPNELFKSTASGIDLINRHWGKQKLMQYFYSKQSAHFYCARVVNKKYPLESAYLQIQLDQLTIGSNKKTLMKIPYDNEIKILKNPTISRLFSVSWLPKKETEKQSVRIYCLKERERALLTSVIEYFIKQYNNEKN